MSKVIVFDLSSSFGYFRKSFTTTNALTHSIIPRSAIEGLIGSILGISSNDYPEKLEESRIAVQILSPVRKIPMKYMHTNPDWWQNVSLYLRNKTTTKSVVFSVPASVELLVNPKYRIYFDNPEINDGLYLHLKEKKTHYTPYLGSSSMIASIKYLGNFEYRRLKKPSSVLISSIIPFTDKIPDIKLEREFGFAIEESIPIHLDNQRISQGTYKVVYTPEPIKISAKVDDVIEVKNGENPTYVKFLPTKITS